MKFLSLFRRKGQAPTEPKPYEPFHCLTPYLQAMEAQGTPVIIEFNETKIVRSKAKDKTD